MTAAKWDAYPNFSKAEFNIARLVFLDDATKTFSPKPVDPAAEKALREAAIRTELDTIDLQSVRSRRAKLAGTATAEDERILSELEARAAVLRAELATLV